MPQVKIQGTLETARALHNLDRAFELHKIGRPAEMIEQAAVNLGMHEGKPIDAAHWLPYCAERYGISRKLEDYVIQPVAIMPSDLPNRNRVSFPLARLSEWSPEFAAIRYKTWKGRPTFVEHANEDYTKANGVILESSMRKMEGKAGNLWKVMHLLAFDRSRDPECANRVLTLKPPHFSMGAAVSNYECSVCGSTTSDKRRPTCEHINPNSVEFAKYQVNGKTKLAHWCVQEFSGFECSEVSSPAFPEARGLGVLWG